MPLGVSSIARLIASGAAAALVFAAFAASATPFLVVDADSGQVLMENQATEVWYPASLTKLMTVYVALDAVRAGRLTMNTPLLVSARAARMQPSKMGFKPGTEVTLDNALKMLMVKSPNDIAVTVAEGVSGSVEAFAAEMNADGEKLGLHESHFVNPNGLHNAEHVSSARDMAMIARALLKEFPGQARLFDIGALQLGSEIIRNHNGLLGRYPGADGMKTGFTCPAGWNLVASASQSGRHLIAVVLGAPSARLRNQEAADLLDRGFAMGGGGSGSIEQLAFVGGTPTARSNVCLRRSAAAVAAEEEEGGGAGPIVAHSFGRGGAVVTVAAVGPAAHTQLSEERPQFDPVPVFVGPIAGWDGPVLGPRPPTAVAGLPDSAKAYAGDKPDTVNAAAQPGEPNAPEALQSAVRTPDVNRHPKPAKHAGAGKAPKTAAKLNAEAKNGQIKSKQGNIGKSTADAKSGAIEPPAKSSQ